MAYLRAPGGGTGAPGPIQAPTYGYIDDSGHVAYSPIPVHIATNGDVVDANGKVLSTYSEVVNPYSNPSYNPCTPGYLYSTPGEGGGSCSAPPAPAPTPPATTDPCAQFHADFPNGNPGVAGNIAQYNLEQAICAQYTTSQNATNAPSGGSPPPASNTGCSGCDATSSFLVQYWWLLAILVGAVFVLLVVI